MAANSEVEYRQALLSVLTAEVHLDETDLAEHCRLLLDGLAYTPRAKWDAEGLDEYWVQVLRERVLKAGDEILAQANRERDLAFKAGARVALLLIKLAADLSGKPADEILQELALRSATEP